MKDEVADFVVKGGKKIRIQAQVSYLAERFGAVLKVEESHDSGRMC
jgi:hypothetical protein